MITMEKRFFNINEIAVYLGVSASGIRKWIRTGKIPFNRLNGAIRFDIQSIERWSNSNRRLAGV